MDTFENTQWRKVKKIQCDYASSQANTQISSRSKMLLALCFRLLHKDLTNLRRYLQGISALTKIIAFYQESLSPSKDKSCLDNHQSTQRGGFDDSRVPQIWPVSGYLVSGQSATEDCSFYWKSVSFLKPTSRLDFH